MRTTISTKSVWIVGSVVLASELAAVLVLRTDPNTTLTFVAALLMAGLTALNLHFCKTLLYPPAMFCALWTFLLTALFLSDDYFYPLSWRTLTFYILGAAAFSLGGSANRSATDIRFVPIPPTPKDRARWIEGILTVSLAAFVAGIPFYLQYAQELAWNSPVATDNSMWALREALVRSGEESGVKSLSQFIFGGLSGYSILIVFIACLEDRVSIFQKCRYYALIGIAFLFNLGTAARVGCFFEVAGLVILASLRRGRINFKLIGSGVLAFFLAFAPAAIGANKGGNAEWSLWENVVGVSQSLLDYSLAGVVAFDRIIQNPDAIPPVWRISRSFLQVASRLGFDVYIPSMHADFTAIRPGFYGNAYTIYFAYLPDLGWVGTLLLMFCLGAIVTLVFRRATEGDRVLAMLFGFLGCCILLSGFGEEFFGQLSLIVKTIVLAWVCYSMPLSWQGGGTRRPWTRAARQVGGRLPGPPIITTMRTGRNLH